MNTETKTPEIAIPSSDQPLDIRNSECVIDPANPGSPSDSPLQPPLSPSDPGSSGACPSEPLAEAKPKVPPAPDTSQAASPNPWDSFFTPPLSSPAAKHQGNGKVAHLPDDIREWVNLQLLGQKHSGDILEGLLRRDVHGISQQNLSNWKLSGGYEEWLAERGARQQRRAQLDAVCSWVSHNRGRIDEAALLLVSSQILDLVGQYDLTLLKTELLKDPQAYFKLIQALTRLNKVKQGAQKKSLTSLVNKPADAGDGTEIQTEAERGLTEETLRKITAAFRLF
jgi:hypothetical protein